MSNRRWWGLRAWLLALGSLLMAARVRADPYHAQTLPLGQRAVGMAGAFTAVADDPSATYYNPAGLVLIDDSSLSAGLTLGAFDRQTIHGGYRTSEGKSTLNHNKNATLPLFLSAIKLLGKRGEDGRRKHAVGLSTFTTSQRRLSFDVEARGPSATGNKLETLQVDNTERTVFYGLSYAYRVTARLSLGLSNFVSVAKTSYSEQRISASLGALNPDGTNVSDSNSFNSFGSDTNVKNLVWRVGALWAVDRKLQLGLMWQTPSLYLHGRSSVRQRELSNNDIGSMGDGSVLSVSQTGLSSHNPLPWELRFGGRYQLYDWLMLAADAAIYGPTGTSSNPVVLIGKRKVDPGTGVAPGIGDFTYDTYHRNWNGNLAFGASARLTSTFHVRAGVYSDLSSAQRVPSTSARYYAPDINRFGATTALGLQSRGFDVSLGMVGVFGWGHASAFNADSSASNPYQRTLATDRMFLFFVNGVKSALGTLAKHAERGLLNIKEKLGGEDDERDSQPEPPPGVNIGPSP